MPRKEKKYHYVYRITNKINGRYYIGMRSTDNEDDSSYMGSGKRIGYEKKKHGIENFTKEIIEFLPSRKEAGEKEKELVNEETLKDSLCLNLKKGGEYSPGTYGKKYSEESRKKMSEWERTPEMRKRMAKAATGRKMTDDDKQKMSQSRLGRKWTEEHRRLTMEARSKSENLSFNAGKMKIYSPDGKIRRFLHPDSEEFKKLTLEGYVTKDRLSTEAKEIAKNKVLRRKKKTHEHTKHKAHERNLATPELPRRRSQWNEEALLQDGNHGKPQVPPGNSG